MQPRFIAMLWSLAILLGGCGQAHLGVDGGCQTATITDGTTTRARWTATAPGYWDMLATDLGVPVSALFR